MITPLLYVKVLATARAQGGFGNGKTWPVWAVSVIRGNVEFAVKPMAGLKFSGMADTGTFLHENHAHAHARELAEVFGCEVQLFKDHGINAGPPEEFLGLLGD